MIAGVKSLRGNRLVDVTYGDEVSRTLPKQEEHGM